MLSECQTVWMWIRTDDLSVMIWVQTVCEGYQQITIIAASKERVNSDCRIIWAKPVLIVCEQQGCRPACTSVQSDQHLCYFLYESIISKLATSERTSDSLNEGLPIKMARNKFQRK